MNCSVSEEQLALYVSGDLNRRESTKLAEHLTGCGPCRSALEDMQFSRQLLMESLSEPENEDLRSIRVRVREQIRKPAKRNPWLRVAAVAAGVGLMMIAPFALRQNTGNPRSPVVTIVQNVAALPNARSVSTVVPARAVRHRFRGRRVGSGLRAVSLSTGADGRTELKIATADPKVFILLPMEGDTHAN